MGLDGAVPLLLPGVDAAAAPAVHRQETSKGRPMEVVRHRCGSGGVVAVLWLGRGGRLGGAQATALLQPYNVRVPTQHACHR